MKKILKEDYKDNAGPLQLQSVTGSDGQPIKFTNISKLPDNLAQNWNEIALSRRSFEELLTYAEKYIEIDDKLKQSLETQFQGDERAKTRAKSRLINRLTITPAAAKSKLDTYRQRQQHDREVAQDAQQNAQLQLPIQNEPVSFEDILSDVPENEREAFYNDDAAAAMRDFIDDGPVIKLGTPLADMFTVALSKTLSVILLIKF